VHLQWNLCVIGGAPPAPSLPNPIQHPSSCAPHTTAQGGNRNLDTVLQKLPCTVLTSLTLKKKRKKALSDSLDEDKRTRKQKTTTMRLSAAHKLTIRQQKHSYYIRKQPTLNKILRIESSFVWSQTSLFVGRGNWAKQTRDKVLFKV
jgi:hypothetical protein